MDIIASTIVQRFKIFGDGHDGVMKRIEVITSLVSEDLFQHDFGEYL